MLINQSIKSKFDRTIGTGTTTVAYQPMYVYYDYGYFGNIYTPTELSVGLPVWITGIRIRMLSNGSYSSDRQTLKLGYCNKEEFDINVRNTFQQVPLTTGGFTSTGITNVKNNFNWAIVSSDENGRWIEINFDTPFNYDPTLGNLIVILVALLLNLLLCVLLMEHLILTTITLTVVCLLLIMLEQGLQMEDLTYNF